MHRAVITRCSTRRSLTSDRVSLEFVQSEKPREATVGETVRPSPRKAPAAREVEPIRAHKLLKAVKVSVTPSAGSNERL